MTNQKFTKTYFIDPGKGKKLPGCPSYSNYQDGRDVDYGFITPPYGHTFAGFKFEPFDSKNYDGKIVAQFEKIGVFNLLRQDFLKYLAALAVLVLFGTILFNFILRPQSERTPLMNLSVMAEEIEHEAFDIDAIDIDTIDLVDTSATISEPVIEEVAVDPTDVSETDVSEKEIEKEEFVVQEKPAEEISETPELEPFSKEITAQFRKEFWELIHQQEKRMSAYGQLYRKYNGKVKGSEFTYLMLTILESGYDFNMWKANLNRIPADEIKSIRNINTLKEKLEEYENS